jgi:hypothetical protein
LHPAFFAPGESSGLNASDHKPRWASTQPFAPALRLFFFEEKTPMAKRTPAWRDRRLLQDYAVILVVASIAAVALAALMK